MSRVGAWGHMACVAGVVVLAGCAAQNDLQNQLKPVAAERWGLAASAPDGVSAAQAWWTQWHDPTLNALIEQALHEHPGMQGAAARVRLAQAALGHAEAADTPQIQARAAVDRQHFTEHGLYPHPVAGASLSSGTLQLEGRWEADLFGRQRAQLQAAVGQHKAAIADEQAARVLLSAQVARAYVQLGRLQAQRAVLTRALAQRQEVLNLIQQRVQAGIDTLVEQRQGEGALPDARQQIESLDEQIVLTRHQLAALTAQAMDALNRLEPAWSTLQVSAVPAVVPMNLLGQRADVMALRWRAEAAGAQSDAARTLFYPNLNIQAYLGLNAIGLDRLFQSGSQQWGLMPAIDLPLFDGDRRRANLKSHLAEQDAAVASYNQAVIDAVREVADQVGSVQSIDRQQQEQAQAQQAAESAYDMAVQRYRAGLGPYLSVLSAEAAVLNQRRLAVDLKARALDARVGLIRSLGGHWPAQP